MNNNTKKTLEINDFTNYLSSNNTFHRCILDKDSLKNTYKEIANFYKDSIIKDNKIYIKSPKNYNSKFDFVELGEYIESIKKSNIYDNHFNQNNNSLSKTRSIVAMTGPGIYRTNCKILDTPKEFFHIDAPGVPSGIDWRNPANIKNLKTKDSNDLKDKKKERRRSFNL